MLRLKEPIEVEYGLLREDQLIFTYFHFASSKTFNPRLWKSKAVCLAYETVESDHGLYLLLIPMSEVAGRMSIQQGAKYLEKPIQGKGVLLGGVPGVEPGRVLILGGGIVRSTGCPNGSRFGSHGDHTRCKS